MSRGRKIVLGVLVVVVLATAGGCSKLLDKFREKHPDPPAGAFPSQVGKMVLEENERWGKNPNCTRADPLHCWAYYVLPGGDNELTRIHYFMQIYDSPEEANVRMEAYAREEGIGPNEITWDDGGPKLGKLLIKNTVHRYDDEHILGFCSASYIRGSTFTTIYHGDKCEPARQFVKDLTSDPSNGDQQH